MGVIYHITSSSDTLTVVRAVCVCMYVCMYVFMCIYTSLQHTAEISGNLCCRSIFIPVSSILQRSLGVFAAGVYLYQSPAYCRGLWESLLLVYIYTSLQHTAEVSGSLCCWSIFRPVSSILQRSLGVFAAGLYLDQSPAYCRGLWESLLLVYIYTSL